MKLYSDNSLSIFFALFSVVCSSNAMKPNPLKPGSLAENKQSSFSNSKPIQALSKFKQIIPQLMQERSQSFVERKNLSLCLRNYSGSFQKNITYDQASISPLLKKLINLEKKENIHVFDASLGDEAIKAFVMYIQAHDSSGPVKIPSSPTDLVHTQPLETGKSELQLIEKNIVSKKFSVLSDVLLLAEKYDISSLKEIVTYAIVSTIFKWHDRENFVAKDIEKLVRDHGLDKLFMIMKDSLVKHSKFYRDDHYVLAQEKTIVDVTISPDSQRIILTSHKEDNIFLGTCYTCCASSTAIKTFETYKSRGAFLFTPSEKNKDGSFQPSRYCVVCSYDHFKVVDGSTMSVLKKIAGNTEDDPYHFFVMSPDGASLLVTTVSGQAFVYALTHNERDPIKNTGVTFNVPASSIVPVFTHDNKEVIISNGRTLCRYDCATGKELQRTTFEQNIQQVYISPKGTCVVVVWGTCQMYSSVELGKPLLTVALDMDVDTRCFFNFDGSLCALTTGRKCYVYACHNDTLKFLHMNTSRHLISQGSFFGERSYLMLCDNFTCNIYDCCDNTLFKEIDLMCLDGAHIVLSNDGSHLIITCEKTSTVYGACPLQSFFKVMGNLLKKK